VAIPAGTQAEIPAGSPVPQTPDSAGNAQKALLSLMTLKILVSHAIFAETDF
jgi:hypothetical protein